MKTIGRTLLAGAVCAAALGAGCLTTAAAAPIDDAYRAYYDFLQEQIDSIGMPVTDVPADEFINIEGVKTWLNENVNYAQLTDFNQDGVPELVFGKEVEGENVSGGSFINCIYTYQNGKMVRLAGNLPIELDYDGGDHFSHEMTLSSGTDGYVYMVWTIDGGGTSYESNYYYTLKDGKWQEVAGFGSDFHPDIYISQDVFSSTGYTTYWYSGPDGNKVELPYSTWNSRRQAVASGGKKTYELHGTINTTLNTLSTRVDPEYASHYRTPSSWAAAAVEEGIDRGIIPKTLQKKYAEPITRAEFCALATAFFEDVSGTEITARATFTDTSDESVEKMGGLGVVQGVGGGRFAPNDLLTREEAAVILTNLSSAMGKELTEAAPSFTDNSTISSWARTQVGQVQVAGIMNGVENGRFAPQDPYTREQSVVTIMRMESGSTVAPTGLELEPEQDTIRATNSTKINYTVYPENATNKTIASWTSSDPQIATVSDGVVTGKSEGTVTITARTVNGVSADCTIRVEPEFQMTIEAKRLPVTVNCLRLKGDSWSFQDVDFVPDDPIIIGKLRVTDVQPESRLGNLGIQVTVSGELESINEDFETEFEPYLKYDLEDEDGHIVESGIVDIHDYMREPGDTFETTLYFDEETIDLDSSYMISFRNDDGKDEADVMAEAPDIALPDLPFSVTDEDGYTTTIEDIDVDIHYSNSIYSEGYKADLSFIGTAEIYGYGGAYFVWELYDSSGEMVGKGEDNVTISDMADDGSFVVEPRFSARSIDLVEGESYTLRLRAAE